MRGLHEFGIRAAHVDPLAEMPRADTTGDGGEPCRGCEHAGQQHPCRAEHDRHPHSEREHLMPRGTARGIHEARERRACDHERVVGAGGRGETVGAVGGCPERVDQTVPRGIEREAGRKIEGIDERAVALPHAGEPRERRVDRRFEPGHGPAERAGNDPVGLGRQTREKDALGPQVWIDDIFPNFLIIEDGVSIAGQNFILTHVKPLIYHKNFTESYVAPVIIKKNAWVTIGVTLLPGVTIGDGAIVASGAVVTKDIPSDTLAAGIPAKVIRELNTDTIGS